MIYSLEKIMWSNILVLDRLNCNSVANTFQSILKRSWLYDLYFLYRTCSKQSLCYIWGQNDNRVITERLNEVFRSVRTSPFSVYCLFNVKTEAVQYEWWTLTTRIDSFSFISTCATNKRWQKQQCRIYCNKYKDTNECGKCVQLCWPFLGAMQCYPEKNGLLCKILQPGPS